MKYYTGIFVAFYMCLLVAISLPTLILWHSGEAWPVQNIIKHQKNHDSLWSHGLIDKEIEYKRALYLSSKPEIILLGSSRVLQYRQSFFNKPFVNLGRGIRLADLANETAFLTQNPNLKVVLYGLDYWNYSNQFCTRSKIYKDKEKAIGMNSNNILKFSNIIPREILFVWPMLREQISFLDFFYNLPDFFNNFSERKHLGLRGYYTDKGGYMNDGSNIDLNAFVNPESYVTLQENEISNIIKAKAPYQLPKGQVPCLEHTQDIVALHKNLKGHGVELIIFIPPLPPAHTGVMLVESHSSKIYNIMMSEMKKLVHEIPVENYLVSSSQVFSKREFLDSFHPGEAVSLRILQDLSYKYPFLKNYINLHYIEANIEDCRNKMFCSNLYSIYLKSSKL